MTKSEHRVVKVNQRALVHKVLARYPEDFAVFRELLQNADDAEASEAQIEFQTSDHAKNSARTSEKSGTTPDLNTIRLTKWIIRNNGKRFESQDWDRLKMIGDGNPHEHKIGAFGVGFYCVFSVTDSPKVVSGGKSLSIFFKGNELYTEHAICPDNEWTSIEMSLKEDMRGSVPKPFDLARFLAATMTFTSHLETTTVFFDNNIILKIAKSKEIPSNVSLPPNMAASSKERRMDIKTVSVVTQKIIVEITNWALAAGTKRPSAQRLDKDDVQHESMKRSFWGFLGKSEAQKVTPPASTVETRTHIASYTVYSAEVTTNPNDDLHKYLKPMTKKDLPSRFRFEMAYFSKEQHDARAAEEKSDIIGSVFRGPQGLFPQLDGDREYMSRVFIGQSTSQTTGIGGHLSGLFIPTVERGSIDLTNCHIAKWNEELLYVGGFLARLAYETEINKVWSTWPKDELTTSPVASSSRDDALYVMRYFSFHTSTPDDKVSKILRDAFFGCSNSDCFPILSNSGIRYTKDVRRPHKIFSSFMSSTPILLPMEPGNPPSLIDTLPDRYEVPRYKFSDVVNELNGRILQKDEMVGLLHWWVSVYEQTQKRDEIRAELMKAAKLNVGSPTKREVTLSSISKFVGSNDWFPWLQSSDPLPLDTIPFSFTNTLNQSDISLTLGWQPMTVVDWLRHLISPDIDSAHDIRTSNTYSNRVLGILGNIWNTLSNDMKTEAKKLMTDVQWISTNKGFRKASEAYFKEADIFNRLPVITANVSDHQVSTVLTEFGVKKDPDVGEFRAMFSSGYLGNDQNLRGWPANIPSQAGLPFERGERHHYNSNLPNVIYTNNEQLFGSLEPPSLEKLIEFAGSADSNTRREAFRYLSDKFDELYEARYDPSKFASVPFIPIIGNGVGAHRDVCSDPSWADMGFPIVHPSVSSRMKRRLQIREAPSAEQLIKILTTRAPKEHSTAAKWFQCLATKQVLSPEHLQEVAKLRIIPIGDDRMMLPQECFFSGSQYPDDHHYRRIFTFINFGEHANNFLKACGVKAKPECSDVVNILLKNPSDFLEKTYTEGKRDLEKYLTELRSIAIGYDGLSKEQKQKMKEAPMLVGCHVAGFPNTDQFSLYKASEILIGDDMENCRTFGNFVRLAPQDEILEHLYESMGSRYLNDCIKYTVKPGKNSNKNSHRCEDIRRAILEKLTLAHEFSDKTRLKTPKFPWENKSRLLVKGCEDLKVEKRLQYENCVSHEHRPVEHPVHAEITTTNFTVTLWLKEADQVHMYDIAVALCRLLFKTPKKNDVPCLMTILEMDKGVQRSCNVDRPLETHETPDLEEKRKEPTHLLPRWMRRPKTPTPTTKCADISELVAKTLEQINKGEPTSEERKVRDAEHSNASKKMTNVDYCAEQKCTDLQKVAPVDSIRVWKQKTARSSIPTDDLTTFGTVISDLCRVFEVDKKSYNIFWHPEDPELMGFNREGQIFLNLAHYTSKHLHLPCGAPHIEWYYIIAHEIAHTTIALHDEHHELLVSAFTSRFFPSLHKLEAVRNYFGCTTSSSS